MKIKVVVFDWDGVLYDSAMLIVRVLNQCLAAKGKSQITFSEFRERLACPLLSDTIKILFPAEREEEQERTVSDVFDLLRLADTQANMLFPDVHDTFVWLKARGIHIYITSGRREEEIRFSLERANLEEYVAEIRGYASPDDKAEFIKCIIRAHGISPDELIFVDDTDIPLEKARATGCYCVASTRGFYSYEKLLRIRPDKIIHNLKNLQGYINLIEYTQPQSFPEKSGKFKKHSGR